MRKSFFCAMVALLTLALTGCSEDGIEEQLAGCQASFIADAYGIGYSLKNENGDRTTTFKEGENIIFDVTIINSTGYELHLADERGILMGIMSVFRSDGEYVGNPCQSASTTFELRWLTVEAHGRLHWSYPWIYDERYAHDDRYDSSTSFSTKVLSPVAPLPKGAYYVMMKYKVMYHIVDNPTPGGGTKGSDDIELRIPFTVE